MTATATWGAAIFPATLITTGLPPTNGINSALF